MHHSPGSGNNIFEQLNLYRSLFEYSSLGVAFTNLAGGIIHVNPRSCEILGYTQEEIEGKKAREFDDLYQLPTNRKSVNQLLAGETKSVILQNKYLHKNGTIVFAKTTISLLYDEAAKPMAFLAMIETLSPLEEAEIASAQRRSLIVDLIEHTGATVTLIDLEGIVLYVNRVVSGIDKEKFVGSIVYNWLSSERAQVTKDLVAKIVVSKQPIHYESEFTGPTGGIHYFYHAMSPVFSGEEVNSVSIVSTEITERKELKRKLSRQKDLITLGLNAAEMGIWEWDVVKEKITWDNNTHQIFGWKLGSFPGTLEAFIESIYEKDLSDTSRNIQYALDHLEEAIEHFRIKRKDDKQIKWVSSKSKIFRNEVGKPIRLLGVIWDSTLEKEREIERIKSTELERQNIELKQFAYLASHDLQEPLRTISSYVNLINRRYHQQLDENADSYLNFISIAVNRMRTQIKDLLDYSLIGQSRDQVTIDCNTLVKDILTALELNISESNATFDIAPLPQIQGHKAEVFRLFQNLISNALKFKRKGIDPVIKITAQTDDEYWKFAVIDNGIGIETQYAEKIFSIFQRLHTREEYEGTGIGLAHCQKIVELHGGKIWIEAPASGGSAFYFTIQK